MITPKVTRTLQTGFREKGVVEIENTHVVTDNGLDLLTQIDESINVV